MSSAAVQQQITQCQQDIATCEEEIAKLKEEIEFIEKTYRKRKRLQENAYEFFNNQRAAVSRYDTYKGTVKASHSFGAKMQKLTAPQTAQSKTEALGELADTLKRACVKKEDELSQQEALLAQLKSRHAWLESELAHWLRVEEEQRQAEAAAAAAAASAKKGR